MKGADLDTLLGQQFGLTERQSRDVFQTLPRVHDSADTYGVGYGWLWWNEPTRPPYAEASVGLTFAGLACLARDNVDASRLLAALLGCMRNIAEAKRERTTVPFATVAPKTINIASIPTIRFARHDLLTMIRHEHGRPIQFVGTQSPNHHDAVIDLHKSEVRAFATVFTAADYWRALGTAIDAQIRDEKRMNDEGHAEPTQRSGTGDTFNFYGPNVTVANRSHNFEQIATYNAGDVEALRSIVESLHQNLPSLNLSLDDRAEIESARSELAEESPQPHVVQRVIKKISQVLTPIATGASAATSEGVKSFVSGLLSQLPHLPF